MSDASDMAAGAHPPDPGTPPPPVTPPVTPPAAPPVTPPVMDVATTFTMDQWKDILPADSREWSAVKEATTPQELMDKFGYFQSRLGRSLTIPDEKATPEQRTEFLGKLRAKVPELLDMPLQDDTEGINDLFSRLGRPEDSTGYETPTFDMVEGVNVDNSQIDAFKEIAHKYNLTKAQFKGVVQDFLGGALEQSNTAQSQFNQDKKELVTEWGATYDHKLAKALRVAQQFFPDTGLAGSITGGTVGAGTLRNLEALASQLGAEGQQLVGEQGAEGLNTPQELREQAMELMDRIKEAPMGDAREALIQKRLQLLKVANAVR